MATIDNKVAVVTGASRGIGAAIAKELGAHGARVVVNFNNSEDKAQEVVEAIRTNGGEAIAVKGDVSKTEASKALIDKAIETYGQLDILVNNAGITKDRSFKKMTEEEWYDVINTNLNSVFNTCKVAVPTMTEQGDGSIINIGSIVAQAGAFGQTNYGAAKGGLIGFTRSLALETAHKGVTVNAVCPGYVSTDMVGAMPEKVVEGLKESIPMKRLADPREIAHAVRFAAENDYMTGQCININGGMHM